MIVRAIPIGMFQSNAYLVACPRTRQGLVIDTGEDGAGILEAAEAEGIRIERIVLTHGHIDHVGGAARLKRALGVPLLCHEADRFLLEAAPEMGLLFGVAIERPPQPDGTLADGQEIRAGDLCLRVIHVPGHSPGHVALAAPGAVFAGDVLFQGSIGRSDLPGGDHRTLLRSIREKLFPLGDDTVVWPGHGPKTTIGVERRTNPFVGDGARDWEDA